MSGVFPSPFDIPTPQGADGWEELYPYSLVFSVDRREHEQAAFWFQDGVHWPHVLTPWEASFVEFSMVSLSQYNSRHYLVPPTLGIDHRILHGYAYLSPVPVGDPVEIQQRVQGFRERAGYYYDNWTELYEKWLVKVTDLVTEANALRFDPLPASEPIADVLGGGGIGSIHRLVQSYDRLVELALRLWNYHFEFLNLGYAAYLDFFGFCKEVFPSMPELAVASMVAGVETDLFRPDLELRRLARLAVATGLANIFVANTTDVTETIERLRGTDAGRSWLAEFEISADPWFNFSAGNGFYHSDRVWIDHLDIPFGFIRDYVLRLSSGQVLGRSPEHIAAERLRVEKEYTALLPDEEHRESFARRLALARRCFGFVENHNFYVEHWSHAVLWRQLRSLGAVLVEAGFLAEPNDIFYLRRDEVPTALWDYCSSWAVGRPARGPTYWPPRVAARRRIVTALGRRRPPPALGPAPTQVTEPFTIMLWGVTDESVSAWLGGAGDDPGLVRGFAASPGVVEGPARVIERLDQVDEVCDGDVLVSPLTAPSWAPMFARIAAVVTDTGGIMSHAAVVCREYGLPAVTGTAHATSRLVTGQWLRVDGGTGEVTVLNDPREVAPDAVTVNRTE